MTLEKVFDCLACELQLFKAFVNKIETRYSRMSRRTYGMQNPRRIALPRSYWILNQTNVVLYNDFDACSHFL